MSKVLTEVKEQDIWADNFQGRTRSESKIPEAGICLRVLGTTSSPGCQSREDDIREIRGRGDSHPVRILL